MQRVAGAKAIPDARRADGAPKQARTSPGPRGREGSRRRPTRHAADGVQPIQETPFRLPHKGEYGGAGGVEGEPLSPHAPRRAGDLPPMSGSSRNAGKNKTNGRARNPRLTPCPAPGRRPAAHAGQQPQDRKKGISHRIGRNVPPHARGNLALKRLSDNKIQKNKTGNDQKSIFGKDTLPVVFVHDF